MNFITLHYGQCGNQIGEALFANIYNDIYNTRKDSDYYVEALNKWFRVTKTNKWEPRSVLIDTENKTMPQKKKMPYYFKNVVVKPCGGSANNWSFGYFIQSKLLIDEVLECVRKELERSDQKCMFLNLFSCAGGTGSGVGSFIIETLKNEFFNIPLTSAVVLPYTNGEVAVQSYNTLLTLSKIYTLSDSIFLFENDRVHYNCINSLNIKNVNFTDMNNFMAHQLVSVCQPLKESKTLDVLKSLCENPLFKLLQMRTAPLSKLESPSNWKSLLTSLSRQSRFDFQQKNQHSMHLKPKIVSAAVICRGAYNPEDKDLQCFKDLNFCKVAKIYYQRRKIFNLENCLTVVSNSNNVYVPLNLMLQDAQNLYKYRAYVHHYKKFGVDESHFTTSFVNVKDILTSYKNV